MSASRPLDHCPHIPLLPRFSRPICLSRALPMLVRNSIRASRAGRLFFCLANTACCLSKGKEHALSLIHAMWQSMPVSAKAGIWWGLRNTSPHHEAGHALACMPRVCAGYLCES